MNLRSLHLAHPVYRNASVPLRIGDGVRVKRVGMFGREKHDEGILLGVRPDYWSLATTAPEGWRSRKVPLHSSTTLEGIRSQPHDLRGVSHLMKSPLAYEQYRLDLAQAHAKFDPAQVWDRVRAGVVDDWATWGGTKAQRRTLLVNNSREVSRRLHTLVDGGAIGAHYNLHKGYGPEYVIHGGIQARAGGDPAAIRHRDFDFLSAGELKERYQHRVWFYPIESPQPDSLLHALEARNPALSITRMRMGSVLMLFGLETPDLLQGLADGHIQHHGDSCFEYASAWLQSPARLAHVGIPVHRFLLPPLPVFHGEVARAFGKWRVSYDFETFATLRFIQGAIELYAQPFSAPSFV